MLSLLIVFSSLLHGYVRAPQLSHSGDCHKDQYSQFSAVRSKSQNSQTGVEQHLKFLKIAADS